MTESKTKTAGNWEILKETTYEAFDIFTVKKSTRVNPRTNKKIDFVRIDGLDWANIIPITADQQVVLIRQYRHGSDDYTLEIPGGCVEVGEDPALSAMRELEEETGYSTKEVEYLGAVRPNPALMSNRCYFYVARGVQLKGEQRLDDGEDIQVVLKPLPEVIEMVKKGEISHSIVVAAFGLFALHDK